MTYRTAGRAISLVAGAALAVAACGNSGRHATSTAPATSAAAASSSAGGSNSIGLTASTITIGQLADVGGPIPGLFSGAVQGLDAWAAYVNSTGGIDGRKITIEHKDSALNCNTYTTGLRAFTTSVFAAVGNYSAVDQCGVTPLRQAAGFPDVQAEALAPSLYSLPNVFSPSPDPPGFFTTGYQWLKDKFGTAATHKTADLYGSPDLAEYQEQTAAAESIGFKYIYSRGFSAVETNFTSDVLRMKSEGVHIVDMTDASVSELADFLQQAAQQDFKPLAVICASGYDASFFKLVGNPANAAPLVMPLPWPLYLGGDARTVPEINTMTTWVHRTSPGAPINLFTVEAWSAGLLFQSAMAKAGTTLTRTALMSALRASGTFTADGLIAPTNPGKDQGATCVVIARTNGTQFVRVDPPSRGFDCNGIFHAK